MPKYRHSLPQTHGQLFVTDGGLETTLVFHDQMELPAFAAFPLLDTDAGRQRLADYYREYLTHAAEHGLGFILEAPTWRANPDWAAQLGYTDVKNLLGQTLEEEETTDETLTALAESTVNPQAQTTRKAA